MAEVTIQGARGDMPLYVATPSAEGPWPGVVVISDALGMTTDLRAQADWLAQSGYLAVAPDLYYWGGRLQCMFAAMREAIARKGGVFDDFATVRSWLLEQPTCSGRVGVIGFCLGGGFALLLAASGDFNASSVNYGDVPKDAMDLLADACPIVGSYGAKDPTLRRAPARLAGALAFHGVDHDVTVYPDAGHSFLNDHDPAEAPLWSLVMGKLSTSEYHDESAVKARRRIVAFFDRHLASGEPYSG
ncbi:MAG: dienelactone hydrolase family protein [Acidimicrobiia bacterium]